MALLIRDAEVGGAVCHVRIDGERITAIGFLSPLPGEPVLEADGGALLPGLWDHHIHLNAAAAAAASISCGPPDVHDGAELIDALAAAPGQGWLRGVGYHDSVAGPIGTAWLDRHGPPRPIRIQHRSGRLWMLNTRARASLGADSPADGRLLDGDAWLRSRLRGVPPDIAAIGAVLASRGVIGLTEVTPRNDHVDLARYRAAGLPQRLRIMGTRDLDSTSAEAGELKLHYHEHDLPALDPLIAEIAGAHEAGRSVAIHCVTRAELVLTLAAIEAAVPRKGDRIEHAAVAPPELAGWMARLGLTVVTQPHFLAERGSVYRREVEPEDRPWLYRLRGLKEAGIPLAAGSDAPFGSLDPWAAMAAAVHRPEGFGTGEALTPEAALDLYLGAGARPGEPRSVERGALADICLIDRPWSVARLDLSVVGVRATLVGGRLVHDSMASIRPHSSAWPADRRRADSTR